MTKVRVGTRGSDLALTQTNWVIDQLKRAHRSLEVEVISIRTHGDTAVSQRFDADWPAGGFTGAIEQALSRNEVDLAVHSYKDLQTAVTAGLVVAAVPRREAVHDVLVTGEKVELEEIPVGFRIGTGSPRRAAQWRRWAEVEIVPIRGNVPTRLKKIDTGELEGVVLAAAGLNRLNIRPKHLIELPVDRFVPSAAQGALAVQTRVDDPAEALAGVLEDADSRRCVETERMFLMTIGAGCHVPVGALAKLSGECVSLHGQLFSEDGDRLVEGIEIGTDGLEIGRHLARRLMAELNRG
jgi:hydroxymethylbilane synthase